MFKIEIDVNLDKFKTDMQTHLLRGGLMCAKVCREAIQQTLDDEAFLETQHAYPGSPPLKHTGDLQGSIHYYGGLTASGDMYFTVFSIASYAHSNKSEEDGLENTHPFMRPVFENMKSDILSVLKTPVGSPHPTLSAAAYIVPTRSRETKKFKEHNYQEEMPNLPPMSFAVETSM